MNRTQIDLINCVGKTLEACIIGKCDRQLLLAFSGDYFALVKHEPGYHGDEGELALERLKFDHRDFHEAGLRQVFDATTVNAWQDVYRAEAEKVKAISEANQRRTYEILRVKYEKLTGGIDQ